MTDPATIANWRGHAARVQQYYEQGEVLGAKVKSLLVITAALKILGLSWWTLLALTPILVAGYVLVGYLWVTRGWYAHGTEIAALDRWTPLMVWDRWMQVRLYEKLGLELNHFPTDRLPDAMTRVMASTQRAPWPTDADARGHAARAPLTVPQTDGRD